MNPIPDCWRSLTQSAHERIRQGELPGAIHDYARALDFARQHPDAWLDPCDALAARVLSALNLAEAQLGSSQPYEACTLGETHAHLLKLSADRHCPCQLRDAAFHHLRETLAALTRIQRAYGEQPEVTAALRPYLQPAYLSFSARPGD